MIRTLDSAQTTDAIRHLLTVEPWSGVTPYEISNGDCEDFQQAVIAAADLNAATAERCTENLPRKIAEWLPGHCWVHVDGRHFDSELPEGGRIVDLPIFRRALARLATKITAPPKILRKWCRRAKGPT